ncbi:hypothetical protein ABZ686_04045 [Streptomyces sp. NPDC006992]|uniref:hypothetical protein n=1 Tax=Streptomyces sp. NPDC006992 TaxID=3155601 RepID=UPI0034100A03
MLGVHSRLCVRLVGVRARGVPEGAEDPHSGAQRLCAALEGRTVLVWGGAGSSPLADGLRSRGAADPFTAAGRVRALREDVMWWRGTLTPEGRSTDPVPPGRADRLLYLLWEMAA